MPTEKAFSDPAELLSFPDGDTILRSSDKIDFRVDLVLLRRASSFFDDLAKLPQPPTANSETALEPIQMEESADVLNIILRHLYPVVPAAITTSAQAELLLRAVNKLNLSIYSLNCALDAHLASLPPLRAWAIAIRYHRATSRREAVARYLESEDQPLEHFLVELDFVSAKDLAMLLGIKKRAVADATRELPRFRWSCNEHRTFHSNIKRLQKIEASPLDSTLFSEAVLAPLVRESGWHCCLTDFESPPCQLKRREVRDNITKIIKNAVDSGDPMCTPDSESAEGSVLP